LYEGIAAQAASFADSLSAGFEEALGELVESLPSHVDLVDYATRTGHRTRPVGCLLAAEAVGGDWRKALDSAVAVELIHKSSVIRDDIVDGDLIRSGQPAFHVAFGISRAIAISDLLWTLALKQDLASGGEVQSFCVDALHEMAAGQLEDVAPSPHRRGVQQRQLVEEKKTGVLSELACRLGALIGGGSPKQIEAMGLYGRNLGTAFQILNDLRNLRGEEQGRTPASDLRKRRNTILSAYAREVGAKSERSRLDALMTGFSDLEEEDVESLREMILASGAVEFGEQTATALMEEARVQLDTLRVSQAKEILESLTQDALLAYAF
jgi:geranylgeranyl pyrophosphate synthase